MAHICTGRLIAVNSLECHYFLYGFLANRGCGTAILKAKLAQ